MILVVAEFVSIFDKIIAGNSESFAVTERNIVVAGDFVGAVVVADLEFAIVGKRGVIVGEFVFLGVREAEIFVIAFAIHESAAGESVLDDVVG